jgi:hypothetical protein
LFLWLLVPVVFTIVTNIQVQHVTKITSKEKTDAQAPRPKRTETQALTQAETQIDPPENDGDVPSTKVLLPNPKIENNNNNHAPLSFREVANPIIIDNKEVEIEGHTKPSTTNKNTSETITIDTSIRKWGCDLNETPLIFVHIGKSGGGSVRARLAASALNYERNAKSWRRPWKDEHYYPVPNNVNVNGSNDNSAIRHGKFCNSQYPTYVEMPHIATPLNIGKLEGSQICNATTPLGIAVACPHPYMEVMETSANGSRRYQKVNCQMCDDDYYLEVNYYNYPNDGTNINTKASKSSNQQRRKKKTMFPPFSETVLDQNNDPPPGSTCDVVYAAHSYMGSELNWLPPRYLKEHWWDQSEYKNRDELEKYWEVLLDDRHRRRKSLGDWAKANRNGNANTKANPQTENDTDDSDTNHRWCPHGYMSIDNTTKYDRPSTGKEYESAYQNCGLPLAERADRAFLESFSPSGTATATLTNFSPFYASMPLHRITVLRDPWSWIISKFFWHRIGQQIQPENGSLPCYDVHALCIATKKGLKSVPRDPITGRELGWMEQYSRLFLIHMCGNDCRIRYENGMMTLDEIEAQVASNLRNAFSVVGILHESESFYDMVTDRISYVDLALNLNVTGSKHSVKQTDEIIACKKRFGTDETFRESVRKTVPTFAALERMYHLGIEVNAFQKEELRQCKEAKGEQPTRDTYK